MQWGLLLVSILLLLLLLFLPPPFLSAAWSQPLAIDSFHRHLVLLQHLFRLCLLVLTLFHLLNLPVLNIFPPVPFPCFSQVSKPSFSESLSCQAAAKAFFSLLSLQIDFSASKYRLAKTFCCLPWTFLLLPLPTLKCISPLCLMSLQQPPGIQAELLNGSQRQWVLAVLFACVARWEQNPSPVGSSLHLCEISGKI